MYQKIKYIIIATMFLLIVVVVLTLDANTRYNAMKKDKGAKMQEQSQQIAQSYYAQQQMEQQQKAAANKQDVPDDVMQKFKKLSAKQKAETAADENDSQDFESPDEGYRYPPKYQTNTTKNDNTPSQSSQKTTSKILTVINVSGGYITDSTGNRLDNYTIEISFKLNDETFAIISDSGNSNLNSSSYIQKKFYIYKKVDDVYQMSNYLFETTERNGQPAADITLIDTDGTLTINYNGSTRIKRSVDNYQLKNGYLQYKSSYPALKYVENNTETVKETPEQETQTPSDSQNGLQPLPQLPPER